VPSLTTVLSPKALVSALVRQKVRTFSQETFVPYLRCPEFGPRKLYANLGSLVLQDNDNLNVRICAPND